MTKLLEQAIAKVRTLPEEEQDTLAALMLSMADADASGFPLDHQTEAAIREGLAQAERVGRSEIAIVHTPFGMKSQGLSTPARARHTMLVDNGCRPVNGAKRGRRRDLGV